MCQSVNKSYAYAGRLGCARNIILAKCYFNGVQDWHYVPDSLCRAPSLGLRVVA